MNRSSTHVFFHPYAGPQVNLVYNLMFCDNLALFRPEGAAAVEEPWSSLFTEPARVQALRRLADDATQESRMRALACRRLLETGSEITPKLPLGVVVEVPLAQSLDVLAEYEDGRIRYINQTGKVAIFESGPPKVVALAKSLVASAQPLVERLGAQGGARLPPPQGDKTRLSVVVSDGLYFGEGRFAALRNDAFGGPVVNAALALLNAIVEPTTH